MRRVAIWSLVALVVTTCGAYADSDAARWEKTIAAFEKRDAENPPKTGGILFVGSSSIRFWDTGEAFPKHDVLNRGFGGSQTSDVLYYLDRIVLPYKPRQIVLYEGDNDIASGKTPEQVFEDTKAIFERVHAKLPDTEILYIAIKPSLARWELVGKMREANAMIQTLAEQDHRITFVDVDTPMLGKDGKPRKDLFVDDGLHLNDEGYAIWNRIVEPLLAKEPK